MKPPWIRHCDSTLIIVSLLLIVVVSISMSVMSYLSISVSLFTGAPLKYQLMVGTGSPVA